MDSINSLTPTGAYMSHRLSRALLKLYNIRIFVRLQCLIAGNVADVFNLTSGARVRVKASHVEDMTRGSLTCLDI
jgi:hypothetical protein